MWETAAQRRSIYNNIYVHIYIYIYRERERVRERARERQATVHANRQIIRIKIYKS